MGILIHEEKIWKIWQKNSHCGLLDFHVAVGCSIGGKPYFAGGSASDAAGLGGTGSAGRLLAVGGAFSATDRRGICFRPGDRAAAGGGQQSLQAAGRGAGAGHGPAESHPRGVLCGAFPDLVAQRCAGHGCQFLHCTSQYLCKYLRGHPPCGPASAGDGAGVGDSCLEPFLLYIQAGFKALSGQRHSYFGGHELEVRRGSGGHRHSRFVRGGTALSVQNLSGHGGGFCMDRDHGSGQRSSGKAGSGPFGAFL